MTVSGSGAGRVLGRVSTCRGRDDGTGVVRVEDRFDTDVGDLWSALTEPDRLVRWLGEVEGDLRVGDRFRARFSASGWEGTGRVVACEPPQRLLVLTTEAGEQEEHEMEATLVSDGEQAVLVVEERGMPVDQRAAYGAGLQVHVEDLAAHLDDRDRCDARARWAELLPAYQEMAARNSSAGRQGPAGP